ncbi:MAG: nucleotidyltransferase family protein [Thioalkalispiraceae bacterium]|jgi:molybdenum cofactor cytidylyltransferase
MSQPPVGILLAAGQGRRFGSNKLVYNLLDDTPMLLVTAQKLACVLPDSIAVINQDLIPYTRQLEQTGLRVVVNTQADRGMGSSIACGVLASPDASGWLITLADMPYVRTETIHQLAARLKDGADIVAPVYLDQRGHPVGFHRCHKEELAKLGDDIGARHIIRKHKKKVELVTTHDAGVIMDVDQSADIVG